MSFCFKNTKGKTVNPITLLGKYFEITITINLIQKSNQITLYLFLMKKILPLEKGDFYFSPEGYRVFTEQYHIKRGYCCESGCKHCPYGYDKKTNTQN